MAKTNQTMIVYEKLKERIEGGFYFPAESLPEIDLASEYDVSRNTIKKALLMLENDGLVTLEQNKGAKVRSYSKKEVLDFLELRVELEGFIIRLAVPCFSEDDLRKLEAIYGQMKERLDQSDLMGYSAFNQQFHMLIYGLCPNQTVTALLTRLKNQMRKYSVKTILVPGRCQRSFAEHGAILEAVKSGDAAAAEASMRAHVGKVCETFEEYNTLLF